MLQIFNPLGSLYFDNTSQFEKEDDVILPGQEHIYFWDVAPEVAPQAADPPCVTYTYFSHNDIVKDYNTGLIGTLLICKPGMFIFSLSSYPLINQGVINNAIYSNALISLICIPLCHRQPWWSWKAGPFPPGIHTVVWCVWWEQHLVQQRGCTT